MTEYAHNHPPRCCCISGWVDKPDTPCPLCPEHGELAQLGNDNPANSIPANVTPRTDYEYACCHQLVGRPHTDYCPGRPATTADDCAHGYRATDSCPMCDATPLLRAFRTGESPALYTALTGNSYTLDGIPMRLDDDTNCQANPLGMTIQPTDHNGLTTDRLHFGAVIPGGHIIATHDRHQCHPDRCGMWATQATQPASQTSTPPTQARTTPDRCPACNAKPGDAYACPNTWHPANHHREPTPHATPTPCPECGTDLAATGEGCTHPHHRA